jgi:branched-chain amino acid transport system substrate-binding protein
MKAKYYWIFSLLVILLVILPIFLWKIGTFSSNNEPLYLAVVGPMSGKSEINGAAMVKGIELYLHEINQPGGIHGHPVKLLVFDDQNQPELAKKWALEIAQNRQVIAVLGHYSSSTSIAAAPIYQKYRIPAISGSATADELTLGNDWYYRTIFNNSDQAALIANYVSKVFGHQEANILFDEDAYGASLASDFTQHAKMIGLEVKHQWHFDSEASFKKRLKKIVATLRASPTNPGMLFLATHSTEAVETIATLKQQLEGIKIPIIGADALASPNFLEKLQQYPQEQAQPGYYSDGVYTIAPLLFDLAGERAQEFRYAFIKKYQQAPMITSAMYYDTTRVIVETARKMLKPGTATTLSEKRQQIKNGLRQLAMVENAIEGVSGSIYFDDNGDVVKSIPIGIYRNGSVIAAMRQFQPLQTVLNRDNLLQDVLDNKIIEINGQFMSQAQVVYVGLDFTDVSELNIQDGFFTADFYLWFRFQGDYDDQNIEFINLLNPLDKPQWEVVSEWHSPVEKGVTTRTYRLITSFKVDLDFHKYPLDQQVMPIYIRHKTLTQNQLIYVVDITGIGLDKLNSPSAIQQQANKFFSIGGWMVTQLAFFQSTLTNDSTLGITEFFGQQQRIQYSLFNVTITIKRHLLNFILKSLMPVIILVVLGYIPFFISESSQKLEIGTNLILATSLFHLQLSYDLPAIDYMVLLESFFYLLYVLAIFIILLAIFDHIHEKQIKEDAKEKGEALVRRFDMIGRIFYPVILIIFVSVIAYQNWDLF